MQIKKTMYSYLTKVHTDDKKYTVVSITEIDNKIYVCLIDQGLIEKSMIALKTN